MTAPVVAVLGAGAAGLAGALELRDRGCSPIVLEAAARAGGKLGSIREGGYLFEQAAVGLLDRRDELRPLAERLGLKMLPASTKASHRWVVRGGKVQTPLGAFTLREILTLLGEPWRKPGDAAGESVRAFFARRFGAPGAFVADLLQTGIYAGDPEQLELEACFPQLAALERAHGSVLRGALREPKRKGPRPRLSSFAGGLEELTAALAAELGDRLRLSTRVRAVYREGQRYRLSLLDRGGMSELTADALLIALPAPDAAEALATLDGGMARELRAFKATPLSVVHVGVRRQDVLGRTDGFGVLAPGQPVVGTLLPSSLWENRAPPERALLTALVGGARSPDAAALPDDELANLVRDDLARTVKLRRDAEPEMVKIIRWPQAVPQYQPGHLARVTALEVLAAAFPKLRLTGAWYRGVSVLDCLRDGKLQAAALLT